MNRTPPTVPGLLKHYGIRPDKRLGQNFLVDPLHLENVVEAAGVGEDDWVLEIGAGVGNLTRLLADRAQHVAAVELDERLLPAFEEMLSPYKNVSIHMGDILALDPARLVNQNGYLVAANIPYYITSAVIRHLLEADPKPRRLALTVQREVAERICARAGEMSLLALSVQVYGQPTIEGVIPAGAFYPPPRVDSAIVRVDLHPEPRIPPPYLDLFFRLARAGFSQKRKTLRNALAGGMHWSPEHARAVLLSAGIDPQRRAQTLSLGEWDALARNITGQDPQA